jgi:hypothetical protein
MIDASTFKAPKTDYGITHQPEAKTITLDWRSGGYDIDLDTIANPEDLLWWIHHLGKKEWPGMTPRRIAALVEVVANLEGWPPYGVAPRRPAA